MTILDQLADHARKRVIANMEECSLNVMRELAMLKSSATGVPFAFEQALRKEDVNFICECKKASPSKGLIAPNFPYLEIAKEYEVAGADCISVLTEPKWFLGNDEYLKEIAEAVSIPCLRKDFTVDEYQIYQAKVLGASAVLLICSILTEDQMKDYIRICDNLGLSALVEWHTTSKKCKQHLIPEHVIIGDQLIAISKIFRWIQITVCRLRELNSSECTVCFRKRRADC